MVSSRVASASAASTGHWPAVCACRRMKICPSGNRAASSGSPPGAGWYGAGHRTPQRQQRRWSGEQPASDPSASRENDAEPTASITQSLSPISAQATRPWPQAARPKPKFVPTRGQPLDDPHKMAGARQSGEIGDVADDNGADDVADAEHLVLLGPHLQPRGPQPLPTTELETQHGDRDAGASFGSYCSHPWADPPPSLGCTSNTCSPLDQRHERMRSATGAGYWSPATRPGHRRDATTAMGLLLRSRASATGSRAR